MFVTHKQPDIYEVMFYENYWDVSDDFEFLCHNTVI